MVESYFSETYAAARSRFLAAAASVGATIHSYSLDIPSEEELSIDVAAIGLETAPTLVTSSGVHGVEGFLGSAVQLAILDRLRQGGLARDIRHVLIHSVNPYGFSKLRRFDEDNVDLNRNFLLDDEAYRGAPDAYTRLNGFLNPESPPARFELFKPKAIWNICRYGYQSIKQAVAGGQYDYPRGIFFGGHRPSKSTQIVRENCDSWIGSATKIVHIDFHSGLGVFGSYKLLLAVMANTEEFSWYADAFGEDHVEAQNAQNATAYQPAGAFGEWMQAHFETRDYRFVAAEFGTYAAIRVLAAIRAENRAHHYGKEGSRGYQSAKAELLECFCPNSEAWRSQVLESGLTIADQAINALRVTC